VTIATRYIPQIVTTPAATPASAPQSTATALGWSFLHAVQVRIPPGHAGFTGLQIVWNGVGIVPFTTAPSWIIGNDDYLVFDVDETLDTQLTVLTFNTDVFAHSHYLRFVTSPSTLATPAAAVEKVAIA